MRAQKSSAVHERDHRQTKNKQRKEKQNLLGHGLHHAEEAASAAKKANTWPRSSLLKRADELILFRRASLLLLEVVVVGCGATCSTVEAVGSSTVSTTTS